MVWIYLYNILMCIRGSEILNSSKMLNCWHYALPIIILPSDDYKILSKFCRQIRGTHSYYIDFCDTKWKRIVLLMFTSIKQVSYWIVNHISEKYFTKSVPSTLKMKVKGGAAVDPDSGSQNSLSVYRSKVSIIKVLEWRILQKRHRCY